MWGIILRRHSFSYVLVNRSKVINIELNVYIWNEIRNGISFKIGYCCRMSLVSVYYKLTGKMKFWVIGLLVSLIKGYNDGLVKLAWYKNKKPLSTSTNQID